MFFFISWILLIRSCLFFTIFFSPMKMIKRTLLYYFGTLYIKARMEFFKSFKVKKFEWGERDSKVKIVLPKWRQDESDPPKTSVNKYVAKTCAQLLLKNEEITGQQAKIEFQNWLQSNEQNHVTEHKSLRPIKQARRFSKNQPHLRVLIIINVLILEQQI